MNYFNKKASTRFQKYINSAATADKAFDTARRLVSKWQPQKEMYIKRLGSGMEGMADLVIHPEHGVSVRKVFNPGSKFGLPDIEKRKYVAWQIGKSRGYPLADMYGIDNNRTYSQYLKTPSHKDLENYSLKAHLGAVASKVLKQFKLRFREKPELLSINPKYKSEIKDKILSSKINSGDFDAIKDPVYGSINHPTTIGDFDVMFDGGAHIAHNIGIDPDTRKLKAFDFLTDDQVVERFRKDKIKAYAMAHMNRTNDPAVAERLKYLNGQFVPNSSPRLSKRMEDLLYKQTYAKK